MLKCEQKTMLIQILSFRIIRTVFLLGCYNSDYSYGVLIGMMCEMFVYGLIIKSYVDTDFSSFFSIFALELL